eukprot:PhF_6_TR40624/c0_g1_i1/m.60948/K11412/SIRT2, SIR2L2; NAD-dependent deacetylase sirtuin 2
MEQEIQHVANLIKSGEVRRIVFLTGAGVSVSAGIPDYRSKGGMYQTLDHTAFTATPKDQRRMRVNKELIASHDLFARNPLPFLEYKRNLWLGLYEKKWKPTLAHRFITQCDKAGLLVRLYTQNIDDLDFEAGTDPEKILPVHGTSRLIRCEKCRQFYPGGADAFYMEYKTKIRDITGTDPSAPATSTPILCPLCGSPRVRSDVVLFGDPLPRDYGILSTYDFIGGEGIDLLIVMGTSLMVAPVNELPLMARSQAKRKCRIVVINKDPLPTDCYVKGVGSGVGRGCGGDGGNEGNEFYWLGECDDVLALLMKELGWDDQPTTTN